MKTTCFSTILISITFATPLVAATVVDGSSPELAAYSGKQIRENGFTQGDGYYWIDEQMGLGSPFQAFVNMTTDGGGWTVGAYSADSGPLPSITIGQNTGTVGVPFSGASSFTLDLSYLGLDQPAEFLYEVHNASNVAIFLGSYSGGFSDATPSFDVIFDSAGLNGQLDTSFDFHRPDRNYSVAIYVRESTTPAPRVVPEPSSMLLLAGGSIALLQRRQRKQSRIGPGE